MNTQRNSNIYLDKEAQEKLMRGVSAVASAVKGTLGAAGHNAILERDVNPGHIITNDGVSIARDVKMTDPVENIGANLAKEISQRSDKDSGDGTTTSVVLLEAILIEGNKCDAHPMEIKRSLDECLPIIIDSIDKQKKAINLDEVHKVATISAEDEKLGMMLQEIYKEIGPEGIVELDNSNTFETFYEIKEGVRLRNCGYMAPYMANDGNKAVYKNPKILITKRKISTISDIDPLCATLDENGTKELVIFCEEIDNSVVNALAFMHIRGIFKTLVIKAPILWKDWLFEDFAKMTGATIIGPETALDWKTVKIEHLGTCDKLITSRDETSVLGIQDMTDHIAKLKEEGKENDQMLVRAMWLNTKAAILKLGANSESELSYKRLKAEDAVSACSLALKDGVVAGGGIALLNTIGDLPNTIGGTILKSALMSPLRQIISNAGGDEDKIRLGGVAKGYNAKTGEVVDMFEAGIIDPSLVVKNAIKNAISVASTVLTSRVIIVNRKEEKPRSDIPTYK